MKPIAHKEIRYIKLGRGGCWADASLRRNEIHFGYKTVPHKLCAAGDWEQVILLVQEARDGRKLGTARNVTREIRDFYTLGRDCLWITFAEGYLWWAFAEPEVIWLGPEENGQGARTRKVIGKWSNADIAGKLLRENAISTSLTCLKRYQGTLCDVAPAAYLLRLINAEADPLLVEAQQVREELISVADRLIRNLHWHDFEIMVDLIFARGGWQRASRVGGTQKDIDIALVQPTTGERACVQVKSTATKRKLNEYVDRCLGNGHSFDRLFFVCHTPTGDLSGMDDRAVPIWTGHALAAKAVNAGLFDWLVERVA